MTKPKKPKDKLERGGYVNFESSKEWEKHLKELEEFKASIEAKAARVITPAMREAEENIRRTFESIAAAIKSNPNSDGWIRLCEILKEAKEDQRVMSSKGANEFAELMWLLAMDALTASSADEALEPLIDTFKSSIFRDMANKGHEKRVTIRQWVISEWVKYKSDYGGNKSRFARRYEKRILEEHHEVVTERHIRERWLKGL